ncbi:di-trans,poly-cis-decaprenylcistransferase [Acinetobacter venetianus]|uniref:Ditrans,polycis-undecaprenyl-diphosphate synthase ((2E,6E)-farnesyl-diphosphate specific) n=1 Tax=Acinetobacter venetianus TaxID=52133 RepID=A0A150HU25_9GAMM|nr:MULTISPECIES: polyprenyl diphosphate synthase [Acinetobacter]ERS00741.1 UDP pyrophosphate synthase [Acinetobacter sp. COS3]KXO78072.1 UDP diphosphate synthase [Acinetobacter venetianus]KXO87319.1 UDP diphosphate synthase [Acinetobacter venetianus]KXZ70348.1 Ditrans,polycis-undecaprenyl-diphosphate synthase ((2E,6E)-farnesyl-diphosphate specific) [Acinetobacter venetianus]KXZ70584.1 Ditrans,polycis-undecaprenyl-diphosphate synthase ((2E,6E)-farnesyl-diphosphate specific) [Acinetobacter venet
MTLSEEQNLPQHIAIIMDGNNRFAKKKQMQKGDGHREGKNVLDPIVEHCKKVGVRALTVFAFSSENWNRPQYEVDLLMQLLEETIHEQLPRMEKFNIALRFIGDRSRLSTKLRALMEYAEQKTAVFDSMTLTIAVSYGGMWDMAQAAKSIAEEALAGRLETNQINVDLFDKYVSLNDLPAVDLLIRTGGDYRLSNFLLWQAAYAELYFTDTLWPEFTVQELDYAFNVFSGRERRFGKTSEQIQQAKIEN